MATTVKSHSTRKNGMVQYRHSLPARALMPNPIIAVAVSQPNPGIDSKVVQAALCLATAASLTKS
jgi:hypothetical protein